MSKESASDSVVDATARKHQVLVVDASRVARAVLARQLKNGFNVIEEDNGESAWQRLMLDSDIAVVVSSLDPPRLGALGLLKRMRASALHRLRGTPLVLLVSGDHSEADVDEWRRRGIAGFVNQSMDENTMAKCLEDALSALLEGFRSGAPYEEAREKLPEKDARKGPSASRSTSSSFAPLLDAADFATVAASLPRATNPDDSLCVVVFGIDRLNELVDRFGADVPDLLTGRIARLLAAKIGPHDVLGRCGEDRADVAIVSHGVDLRSGVHFGRRVCKSLAVGQIAVYGRKIRLTTSVGVAASSDDRAASPEILLALARERMKQAMRCGGNTVCAELHPDCPLARWEKVLPGLSTRLGKALESERKEALAEKLAAALKLPGTGDRRQETEQGRRIRNP
ncbi:MAG: diguanylate cyclase [Candidatus Accumulibacter sp.]|nr:diguanylate cyclase [Accumulibacter sp.]